MEDGGKFLGDETDGVVPTATKKRKEPSSSPSLHAVGGMGLVTSEDPSSSSPSKVDNTNSSNADACPYLDTVNRSVLDFDFEASCSVTMETGPHVYGCLVCGKYFRGRGGNTPAYTHSVEEGHYLFVHLRKGTFHCLPDDYEVHDPSLNDIKVALHPTFTPSQVATIDTQNTELKRDLFGRRYLPGYVGLNNLHKTDGINAVIQALVHVPPLRDFFLRMSDTQVTLPPSVSSGQSHATAPGNGNGVDDSKRKRKKMKRNKPSHQLSPLVLAFGSLVRKLWSSQRFKSTVDPHPLIQIISTASKKRFQVGQQCEAGEFLAWFLHQLHVGLGGKPNKPGSSMIHQVFQGRVQVTTRQIKQTDQDKNAEDDDDRGGSDVELDNDVEMEDRNKKGEDKVILEETTRETHFLQLTLDIPEKPLFRDDDGGLVIPQEPLVNVLQKFDGVTFSDVVMGEKQQRRRYQLLELPPYLILHLARFKTDIYSRKKNPTIVAFPVKNLDLSPYVKTEDATKRPSQEEVRSMSVTELKALLKRYGRMDLARHVVEKDELAQRVVDLVTSSIPQVLELKYNLVANITHDSPVDVGREGTGYDPLQEGSYKCHVQHKASNQWYELQDLHVKETMPQLIGLSESYLLIFKRKDKDE